MIQNLGEGPPSGWNTFWYLRGGRLTPPISGCVFWWFCFSFRFSLLFCMCFRVLGFWFCGLLGVWVFLFLCLFVRFWVCFRLVYAFWVVWVCSLLGFGLLLRWFLGGVGCLAVLGFCYCFLFWGACVLGVSGVLGSCSCCCCCHFMLFRMFRCFSCFELLIMSGFSF